MVPKKPHSLEDILPEEGSRCQLNCHHVLIRRIDDGLYRSLQLARQRGYDVRIPEPRDIVDGMVSKVLRSLPWIKGL